MCGENILSLFRVALSTRGQASYCVCLWLLPLRSLLIALDGFGTAESSLILNYCLNRWGKHVLKRLRCVRYRLSMWGVVRHPVTTVWFEV